MTLDDGSPLLRRYFSPEIRRGHRVFSLRLYRFNFFYACALIVEHWYSRVVLFSVSSLVKLEPSAFVLCCSARMEDSTVYCCRRFHLSVHPWTGHWNWESVGARWEGLWGDQERRRGFYERRRARDPTARERRRTVLRSCVSAEPVPPRSVVAAAASRVLAAVLYSVRYTSFVRLVLCTSSSSFVRTSFVGNIFLN